MPPDQNAPKKPTVEPGQFMPEPEPRLSRFLSRISEKTAEQLNPQQIRTARRLADKRGLKRENDQDTLEVLKTLVETGRTPAHHNPDPDVRARRPSGIIPRAEPFADISTLFEIEARLIHRRQRRMRGLIVRLAFFVLFPALVLSGYFLFWATPHFASYTELVIQRADASVGGQVGLLGAFQPPMTTEAASVQGYLTSRDAMAKLIAKNGYRSAISDPQIDRFQRLSATAGNEKAFKTFQRQIRIGFEPTDNVIKMEVISATPENSLVFANALIDLAEAKVDQMSQRLRTDPLRGAHDSYDLAESKLAQAQANVLTLQHKRGVLSTELEASSQMAQISALQTSLQRNQLELAELRDNLRPNPTREAVLVKSIERHHDLIVNLRASLTSDSLGNASLARIDAEPIRAATATGNGITDNEPDGVRAHRGQPAVDLSGDQCGTGSA